MTALLSRHAPLYEGHPCLLCELLVQPLDDVVELIQGLVVDLEEPGLGAFLVRDLDLHPRGGGQPPLAVARVRVAQDRAAAGFSLGALASPLALVPSLAAH